MLKLEVFPGLHVTDGGVGPLSVALMKGKFTGAVAWPVMGERMTVAGHVIVGLTASLAVTRKVHEELFSALSNAVHVTVVA
jgi:hypothetical protein